MEALDLQTAKHILLTLVGLLWHGAMKWDEYRKVNADKPEVNTGLFAFLKTFRSQNLVSIFATVAAFVAASEMEWMNAMTALASGYMGNSVAENAMNRFAKKE